MVIKNYFPRLILLGVAVLAAAMPVRAQDLEQGFREPPKEAHPGTWWHWVNGNVSKEGISLDLEAMKRIGLSGAQIFNVNQGPVGPVKMFSDEWRDLTQHAIHEADRLGLQLGFENGPGWSESNGPWVTQEESMQFVYPTEVTVTGGRKIKVTLPQDNKRAWHDIAVWAFPALAGDTGCLADLKPKLSASAGSKDLENAVDGKLDTVALIGHGDQPKFLKVELPDAATFGTARLTVVPDVRFTADVQVSDDGITFRKVGSLARNALSFHTVVGTFAPVKARIWRVVLNEFIPNDPQDIAVRELTFGGARLEHPDNKAALHPDVNSHIPTAWNVPAEMTIDPKTMVDLSDKLAPDGTLEWDAPAGTWTIIRFGHASNGVGPNTAPDGVRGIECDKLSSQAVADHFNKGLMNMVLDMAGPPEGKTVTNMLADSWEAGCLNWTPMMRTEFQKRRGYDPLPWLPALTGRVIGSVDQTERFLWDFRRVIADLIAENHYGTLQKLGHEHGLQFYAEAPGIFMPTIADELQCKARTDIPMGEFWIDLYGTADIKEAASAAHINGLRWVAAESFTARPAQAGWKSDPYSLKALGDLAFCTGVNRFMFSSYAAEPYTDKFPGVTLGPYGLNFGRTVTWWEQSRPWVEYISRCQWLLSQGRFVADVCYFYGEGAPNTLTSRGHLSPGIPEGYDYDGCDAETLQKMEVRDGRLTLPGGMSYRVLALADSDRMTPKLLEKVRELVQAGATVVGAPPSGSASPSLQDYPKADDVVKKLVKELWGEGDGKVVDKGRVSMQPLEKLLPQIGLPEDFSSTTVYPKMAAIHRKTDNADIYFVSNQANHAVNPDCTFRVTGRVPELWHPDTGVIETAPIYRQDDGRTTVPLQLDPSGSVFVVFRKATGTEDAIVSMQRTDSTSGPKHNPGIQPDAAPFDLSRLGSEPAMLTPWVPGTYTATFASGKKWRRDVSGVSPAKDLSGPWMLRFPPKWGAPGQVTLEKLISWTDDPDDGVKYFSGTATYTSEFQVNDGELFPGKALRLNLGEVKNLAEVTVNGKNLGVLWKPPFVVDLTGIARAGTNTLEVKVTNLWPNRMIGDQKLPPEQRYTWSTNEPYQADSPLLTSGLIGPVTLQSTATLRVVP